MIHKNILLRFIILLTIMLSLVTSLAAAQFPEKGNHYIVDPHKAFELHEKTTFERYLAELKYRYTIVALEEIQGDGFAYATSLFAHYKLGKEDILIIILLNPEGTIYYAYGQTLIDKGLTDALMNRTKEARQLSYTANQRYLTFLRTFVSDIERYLAQVSEQSQREQERVIQAPAVGENEASGMPWWIKALVIAFFLLVSFIIYSLFMRKNIIRHVERLEGWKIKLENKPFSSELAKIKGLNLSGETEARFDKWKQKWEEIITSVLPDIEESLIDIEEFMENYRFLKAKENIRHADQTLEETEATLAGIVQEINDLIDNVKNNGDKVTQLYEAYHELKTELQKNALILGISYGVWLERFKKAASWFERFEQAQKNGDYYSANDMLQAIEEVFTKVKEALKVLPRLMEEIETHIPEKLKEVQQAIEEMKSKGYQLNHTDVEAKLKQLQNQKEVQGYLENGQIKEAKAWIESVHQQLEALFSILEKEVETKAKVLSALKTIEDDMVAVRKEHELLMESCEKVKTSYTWEKELEQKQQSIQQQIAELESVYQKITSETTEVEKEYVKLYPYLAHFLEKRALLGEGIEELTTLINSLREEELEAAEMIRKLKQQLTKIKVNLRKSNLPGVPEHLNSGLYMTEDAIHDVELCLQKIPIDMNRVQHTLKEAKTQAESVAQVAKKTIEHARKAELYIQYANKYRRYNEEVRLQLEEAEHAFRNMLYKDALELVEDVLDNTEKNWREHLEPEESVISN